MTDAVARKDQRGKLKNDPAARALAAENPHRLRALVAALGPIPGNTTPITSLERIALAAYCGHKPSQEFWPGVVEVRNELETLAPRTGYPRVSLPSNHWLDTGHKAASPSASDGPIETWVLHLAQRWGTVAATNVVLPLLEAAQSAHLRSYADMTGPSCAMGDSCAERCKKAMIAYRDYATDPSKKTRQAAVIAGSEIGTRHRWAAVIAGSEIGARHRWASDWGHFLSWVDTKPALASNYCTWAIEGALLELDPSDYMVETAAAVFGSGDGWAPAYHWQVLKQAGVNYALGLE